MSKRNAKRLRDGIRRLIVVHEAMAEAKRPCGAPLSLPHAYALLELHARRGAMTVSMLAQTLAIDRTNVSRLCLRMEKAGELTRQPDPNDGRAVKLVLTPHGEELARSVDVSSSRHFGRLARSLGSSTDSIVEALAQLEQAMADEHKQQDQKQDSK